jgi:hypothetical protein
VAGGVDAYDTAAGRVERGRADQRRVVREHEAGDRLDTLDEGAPLAA